MTLALMPSCAGSNPTADSYCAAYVPVIVNKGDSAIAARLQVKQRIAANEVTHRRLCR